MLPIFLAITLTLTGAAMAAPKQSAKEVQQGLYSEDKALDSQLSPYMELLNEHYRRAQEQGFGAGRGIPLEEFKRRWSEIEKEHGPLDWGKIGRMGRKPPGPTIKE